MFFNLPKSIKFTASHKKTLNEAKLGENGFGAILPVFDAALKLIDAGQFGLTAALQPSLDSAKKLNALLPKPIALGLKRPVPKSYPHVLGLFLLLRATGLTIVDTKTKNPKLRLDPEFYRKWQSFNATERYFILLESWFLRAYVEILEEWDMPYGMPNAFDSWFSWQRDFSNGQLQISGKKSAYQDLKYRPRFYNLGLLELFGFIEIEHGAVIEGETWQIETIRQTDLGTAMLALLSHELFSDNEKLYELYEDESLTYGALQALLTPYFPAWKNNLGPVLWEFRQGQHIFKLKWRKIWRRLAIDAYEPLDFLARLILKSVDFDNDHLYQFSYRRRSGIVQKIHHPQSEEFPDAAEIRIGNLPLAIGQTLDFLFDFGDQWEFELQLEAVNPKVKQKMPEILEIHGESPEQYPYYEGEDGDYDEIFFFLGEYEESDEDENDEE